MKKLETFGLVQLEYEELREINGGNKLPPNWSKMSTARKAGYVIGHATFAALDLAAALLLPWV